VIGMVVLVFTVCLLSAPAQCEQREMFIEPVTLLQCIHGAPPELATWLSTHPNWRITRFWCRGENR
jgi:hypothetical protein